MILLCLTNAEKTVSRFSHRQLCDSFMWTFPLILFPFNRPLFHIKRKLTDTQTRHFLAFPQSQWDRNNGWDSDTRRRRLSLSDRSSAPPVHPGKLRRPFGSCRAAYRDRSLDHGRHNGDLLHETTWNHAQLSEQTNNNSAVECSFERPLVSVIIYKLNCIFILIRQF